MPYAGRGHRVQEVMYARAVDEASARLVELRRDQWGGFGLAATALGLALVASQLQPAFALPLFLGGVVVGALGMRALWRRWELLERLAAEPDACVISEVLVYACRETTMQRRHNFAARLRRLLAEPRTECAPPGALHQR
jgi:hypothetical protein